MVTKEAIEAFYEAHDQSLELQPREHHQAVYEGLVAAFSATPLNTFGALQAAFLRGANWVVTNGGADGLYKAAYDYADYETSPITAEERAALERP